MLLGVAMSQPGVTRQSVRPIVLLFGTGILALIGAAGCQAAAPAVSPESPAALSTYTNVPLCLPTTLTPPWNTIPLGLVDTAQVPVTTPIHQQLLVAAFNFDDPANRCDYGDVEYLIGLLDLPKQRLIQLTHVRGYPPDEMIWKPDGTQFIYNTRGIGSRAADAWVFQADGKELFHGGLSAEW